jgi:hypothetical protein
MTTYDDTDQHCAILRREGARITYHVLVEVLILNVTVGEANTSRLTGSDSETSNDNQ